MSKVFVISEGDLVALADKINFIAGTNITLDVVANPSTDSVDITVNGSGGGSGLTQPEVLRVVSLGL